MYASRVQGKQMLLENPARDSRAKKERIEKRARQKQDKDKKKRGLIGKRKAKEKGVWRFDPSQAKFVLHLPPPLVTELAIGLNFLCPYTNFGWAICPNSLDYLFSRLP